MARQGGQVHRSRSARRKCALKFQGLERSVHEHRKHGMCLITEGAPAQRDPPFLPPSLGGGKHSASVLPSAAGGSSDTCAGTEGPVSRTAGWRARGRQAPWQACQAGQATGAADPACLERPYPRSPL